MFPYATLSHWCSRVAFARSLPLLRSNVGGWLRPSRSSDDRALPIVGQRSLPPGLQRTLDRDRGFSTFTPPCPTRQPLRALASPSPCVSPPSSSSPCLRSPSALTRPMNTSGLQPKWGPKPRLPGLLPALRPLHVPGAAKASFCDSNKTPSIGPCPKVHRCAFS